MKQNRYQDKQNQSQQNQQDQSQQNSQNNKTVEKLTFFRQSVF